MPIIIKMTISRTLLILLGYYLFFQFHPKTLHHHRTHRHHHIYHRHYTENPNYSLIQYDSCLPSFDLNTVIDEDHRNPHYSKHHDHQDDSNEDNFKGKKPFTYSDKTYDMNASSNLSTERLTSYNGKKDFDKDTKSVAIAKTTNSFAEAKTEDAGRATASSISGGTASAVALGNGSAISKAQNDGKATAVSENDGTSFAQAKGGTAEALSKGNGNALAISKDNSYSKATAIGNANSTALSSENGIAISTANSYAHALSDATDNSSAISDSKSKANSLAVATENGFANATANANSLAMSSASNNSISEADATSDAEAIAKASESGYTHAHANADSLAVGSAHNNSVVIVESNSESRALGNSNNKLQESKKKYNGLIMINKIDLGNDVNLLISANFLNNTKQNLTEKIDENKVPKDLLSSVNKLNDTNITNINSNFPDLNKIDFYDKDTKNAFLKDLIKKINNDECVLNYNAGPIFNSKEKPNVVKEEKILNNENKIKPKENKDIKLKQNKENIKEDKSNSFLSDFFISDVKGDDLLKKDLNENEKNKKFLDCLYGNKFKDGNVKIKETFDLSKSNKNENFNTKNSEIKFNHNIDNSLDSEYDSDKNNEKKKSPKNGENIIANNNDNNVYKNIDNSKPYDFVESPKIKQELDQGYVKIIPINPENITPKPIEGKDIKLTSIQDEKPEDKQKLTKLNRIWTSTDFSASDISCSSKGDIMAIGKDKKLYKYNLSSNKFSSLNQKEELRNLVTLELDSNGTPFVINTIGDTFFLDKNEQWVKLHGCASDISIGKNGEIYKLGCTNHIRGYSIYKLGCVIQKENQEVQKDEFSEDNEFKSEDMDSKPLNFIEKGLDFYLKNYYENLQCDWKRISGYGKKIVVANDGLPYIISKKNGFIYKLDGKYWDAVSGIKAKDFSVSNDNILFIVKNDGKIYTLTNEKDCDVTQFDEVIVDKITTGPYLQPTIIKSSDGKVYTSSKI